MFLLWKSVSAKVSACVAAPAKRKSTCFIKMQNNNNNITAFLLANPRKWIQNIYRFWCCLGFVCPIPLFFLINFKAVNLVVVYISAGNIQYIVEEELVQLCAHSWTSARGNLRMAGAAKPSPSRVEICNQPGVQKCDLLNMPWNTHLTFTLTPYLIQSLIHAFARL